VEPTVHDDEEMTYQTRGLMTQLKAIRRREAANRRAADKIAADLRSVYMTCRVMADTPPEEVVPILAVQVSDMGMQWFKDLPKVDGCVKWCAEVERHGGPRIDPEWLRGYMDDHLAGRDREIDPIVQEAMVIKESRVIPLGGGLVDVDTGKPILTA